MPALAREELLAVNAWWRAANYLTVGQIYLRSNPLLREPLEPSHIKPRLLGHWGTSPGLNLLYAHLNRLIRARRKKTIFLAGPGHGGPALIANVWLEGTWSEVYPEVSRDQAGMHKLFRQFSTPGGVPSHVSPPVPGSIHEGGELGYVLTHAFGAAFDNPELLVVAVVGDGEAETAPLEGSWKGIAFLNPARDGAVLPVLHLNGYKIANPTVLARKSEEEMLALLRGHGYDPIVVAGDEPMPVHAALAEALESCLDRIAAIQKEKTARRPRWPMIVLRTPKGWTGPDKVDGVQVQGTFRAHQVPLANVRENREHLKMLEAWMRSYKPEELFDERGAPRAMLTAQAPEGSLRMSASPHANGGRLLVPLDLPDYATFGLQISGPAKEHAESTKLFGVFLREVMKRNVDRFRIFCPDELTSNRLGAVLEETQRCWMERIEPNDDRLSREGRVIEVLSEHNCEGWLEGYLLTGRHGLFCTYEAFAMIVASMAVQHSKWLEMCRSLRFRASVSSLNVLLTSTCWRNDHNGFSHQGPGFIDTLISKPGAVARVYLPPDANCLLSVGDHCLRSRDYVNLIVIDKQPQLQWLTLDQARAHCARGAGVWQWASNDAGEPDVVLACAGDVPTLETCAAASFLRERAPGLKVRVANVVDLFTIADPSEHPHGMPVDQFEEIFTRDCDVIFAFHGYHNVVHALLHGRPDAQRFHVRGYREEGTTTTPFDMVVLNGMSRFHLAAEALRRTRHPPANAGALIDECEERLRKHHAYVREHLEDMPEIRNWVWRS
jgi:xylulose-5-phosphate/fructose-6-phosphate phosphoketolase